VSLAHLPAEQSAFESCHPLTDLCWLTPQDLPASFWHCSLGKNHEGVSNTPIERHGSNEQLGTAFTPIENHLTEVSPVECTPPPLCASAGPSVFGRAPFHEETSCGSLPYAVRTVLVTRSQKCKNIREKATFESRTRVRRRRPPLLALGSGSGSGPSPGSGSGSGSDFGLGSLKKLPALTSKKVRWQKKCSSRGFAGGHPPDY
jgi:hypothetical protein